LSVAQLVSSRRLVNGRQYTVIELPPKLPNPNRDKIGKHHRRRFKSVSK